ncbi:Peroxidase [Musa troglodytarum]|uniref:Peroxidase n=1 Tax=Musa troglodytarum TaxID=320322 RepID=A0A9E7FBT8_9LILI|nr:Peroxidase [Musa troglodytarum]
MWMCPKDLSTNRMVVEEAIAQEPRMGASLLRLHFHDCFVNGCDGSIRLDDTSTFTGEKTAKSIKNSVRGVDRIKAAVVSDCNGSVVSCGDILAVAARDSVVAEERIRGEQARATPPATIRPANELVDLSGALTLGLARCTSFGSRLYNEASAIDGDHASTLKARCPPSGGNHSPTTFDNAYFQGLVVKKGGRQRQ